MAVGVEQINEIVGAFTGDDSRFGVKAVFESVAAGAGFSCLGLGDDGVLCVAAIGGGLSLGGMGITKGL